MSTLSNIEQRLLSLEAAITTLQSIISSIFNISTIQTLTSVEANPIPNTFTVCAKPVESSLETSTCSAPAIGIQNVTTTSEPVSDAVPTATGISGRNLNNVPFQTSVLSSIQKPRYDGRSQFYTAAEFIEKFEQYVQNRGISSDQYWVQAVYDCLSAEPKLWYRTFAYRFDSWASFKDCFLRRFWGCKSQRMFVKELRNCGSYIQKGKRSRMSSYYARMLNNCKYLSLPPTEAEFNNYIKFHFQRHVQEKFDRIRNVEQGYEMLVEEDRHADFQNELHKNHNPKDYCEERSASASITEHSGGEDVTNGG